MKSCTPKPVQFWLSDEAHRQLKAIAALKGEAISELFRREAVALIEKNQPWKNRHEKLEAI